MKSNLVTSLVGVLLVAWGVETATAEILTCDQILQMRADRTSWNAKLEAAKRRSSGWSAKVDVLAVAGANNEVAGGTEVERTLTVEVDRSYQLVARVMPQNLGAPNDRAGRPAPFFYRFISRKQLRNGALAGRCSSEWEGSTAKHALASHGVWWPEEYDNTYWVVVYDAQKRVLSEGEFITRPKSSAGSAETARGSGASADKNKSSAPASAADPGHAENEAGLRVAIKSLAFLERCSRSGMNAQPMSTIRDRVARIEKSAQAMKIDVAAARRKSEEDLRSEMEMFDMFEAMGPMNLGQLGSLRQFCALSAMNLQQVAKHFADLDRAAGR